MHKCLKAFSKMNMRVTHDVAADLNHVGGGHVTKRQSCLNKKRNLWHVSSARIIIRIMKWGRVCEMGGC
jgi:hypothetical protein